MNEGTSEEQLWITGGNQHRTTSKAIDIYDGESMTSHDVELPLDLYHHNIVQIKADKILVMGGLMGSAENYNDKNYAIFVMNLFNCKLLFLCSCKHYKI